MRAVGLRHLARRANAPPTGGRQGAVRQVATRLAAQTVALVMVLLIVLEIAVYLLIQRRLVSSLQSTLTLRAHLQPAVVCRVSHLTCPGTHGHGPQTADHHGGQGEDQHGLNPDLTPSDVSSVFISPSLQATHADGAIGPVILDRAAAALAIHTRTAQGFDTASYRGQTYLVYTSPLAVDRTVIGAVQNSISETQYRSTLASMRATLATIAVLGFLGSSIISAALVQRALRPIRVAMQRQRDFVADAAHELRTPLAIQRAVAEVAMADLRPPDGVEPTVEELETTVEQMLGENQHLTRLVEDLSLLARTDTDTVSIDREQVDLSSLVTETAREIGYLAEIQGQTLSAEVMPRIAVLGDVVRLRQLILILLDNALKHTPPGGTISVRLDTAQGSRARLEVSDTGPGITPADLPRIFDRFYRSETSRAGKGTGLGLAIAQWIVEAHGGQIAAGNVSPYGARFTVMLPTLRRDPRTVSATG